MIDLTPILQTLVAIAATVLTGLAGIYVPKAIAAFQERTGVVLTENQRQTILGAVQTAAGVLETKLDQGAIAVAHVNVTDPRVQDIARQAINAVPVAAAALGMTVDSVARMVVGAVDTGSHGATPAPSTTALAMAADTAPVVP